MALFFNNLAAARYSLALLVYYNKLVLPLIKKFCTFLLKHNISANLVSLSAGSIYINDDAYYYSPNNYAQRRGEERRGARYRMPTLGHV